MNLGRSRRRIVLLTLLLLALGAWVLVGNWEQGAGGLDTAGDGASEEPAPEMLRAEADREGGRVAGPAAGPTPTDARGPLRVTVLGRSGQPLRGTLLRLFHPDQEFADNGYRRSDDQGDAVFRDVPYDGSAAVSFFRSDGMQISGDWHAPLLPADGSVQEATVRVTGPEVVCRARTGLLLHVTTVAAETGRALPGMKIRPYYTWAQDTRAWHETPVRLLVTPEIAERVRVGFGSSAPEGWVFWEPSYVDTTVNPYAESLAFVYPLRREMKVIVTPVDEQGDAAEAKVTALQVAGRMPSPWWSQGDAYGRIHVRRVPFLPGEILEVATQPAGSKEESGGIYARAVIPADPETPIDLRVVLPETIDWARSADEVGSPNSGGPSPRGQPPKAGFDNMVVIRVRRHDGSPAVGAFVSIGPTSTHTDARGVATLHDLETGEAHVQIWQPGLLPMPTTLTIVDGQTHRLDLREGIGGIIELSVVDGDGRPLACAHFSLQTISGLPWLDVTGTRQRVDRFVDHRGERVLQRVEPGRVTVTATWGSRTASHSLLVVEGATSALKITLPAPPPPPR